MEPKAYKVLMIKNSVVEDALRSGWKYCFKPNEKGEFPTLDELAFMGDEKDAGFVDFITSLLNDIEKRAFFSGYKMGASDLYQDTPETFKAELAFEPGLNEVGAWRAWESREKMGEGA